MSINKHKAMDSEYLAEQQAEQEAQQELSKQAELVQITNSDNELAA